MAKSSSSSRWIAEHANDLYVKQAKAQGLRSRAVFKLKELDEKSRLFKPGMTVVDLGAAPGGWSEYALKQVGNNGTVIALDILPMDEIIGVDFIQGDFTEQSVLDQLHAVLHHRPVDMVLSDMAPNMSGERSVDQARAMYLAELALEAATGMLTDSGIFLVKLFHGEGFDAFRTDVLRLFKQVSMKKPDASRARSRETYLLAKGFKND